MNWNNIQSILPKAAGKYNFAKTLKAIEVCQEYRKLAAKTLPMAALENTYPKTFKDQTLTIGVVSSQWAEKVQMNKHRIHQSLQKKFGERAIKNIRIVMVEEIPSKKAEKNSIPPEEYNKI